MKVLTGDDLMPIGKHRGTKMIDVPASYLLWCLENMNSEGNIVAYAKDNKEALLLEVKKEEIKKRL